MICPLSRFVDLADGTTVPVVLKPLTRPQDALLLPTDQEYIPKMKRFCPKVHVINCVVLPAKSQSWVQAKTQREGLILVTPVG